MVIPRRRQSQRPRIQPMESCSHDWRRTSLLVTLAPKMLRSASPREVQPPPRDRSLEPKAGAGRLVPRQAGRRPFGLPPETTGAVRGGDRSAEPFGIDIRRPLRRLQFHSVRLVIARCSVDYTGRLTARLASAVRLLIVKADGSVLVHSDGGSYKPLNWMSPPCRVSEATARWVVTGKSGETLTDSSFDLGVDPGLVKDGVESHLQELLAAQMHVLGEGWRLIRREYPTPIGPVDLMCRDAAGGCVAIEIKRRGEIDGVEQLTRYLELLNRDPLLAPVQGIFAAQEIRPQARVLAEDRGIRCVTLDYESMRGAGDGALRLF